GGEIEVDSTVGKGSTFTVNFSNIDIVEISQLQNEPEEEFNKNIEFEEKTILIADDVTSNRDVVKAFLSPYNLNCIEAVNGKDALEKAVKYKPSLIFLDLRMPEMDGFEFMRKFKKDSTLCEIPVIIISASVMQGTDEIIKSTGCNSFLKKPISKIELLKELKKYIPNEIIHSKTTNIITSSKLSEINFKKLKSSGELSEIIKLLENSFQKKWDKINETKIIEEIIEFGDEIRDLGTQFNIEMYYQWGNQIKQQAENFDIKGLNKNLEKFPEILKKIKEHQ
ncbi:MAG: response regulator, partial [Calditrichia bacterium]|nr:response regulator [Calditrichia bacterium]